MCLKLPSASSIPQSIAGFSFYQEQSGACLATRVNFTAEFAVRGNQFNEIVSFPDTKPIFAANFAFRGKQTDRSMPQKRPQRAQT